MSNDVVAGANPAGLAPQVLRKITRRLVLDQGWQSGTDVEDEAALLLFRWGARPYEVKQQHVPERLVAIEIDGWHHGHPDQIERDVARDEAIVAAGWTIHRVCAFRSRALFEEQLAAAWLAAREAPIKTRRRR